MVASDYAQSADRDVRLAKGIQDNSFLIEESYNQEPGVVQHITGLRRQGRDWFFTFVQEWPLGSQTHQFSYTVPYAWLRNDGEHASGFGDVLLNYRYQAMVETDSAPAFAPRASLILPTGDRKKGTGQESYGVQIKLPMSKIVSDRTTIHGNAGATRYFDVQGRQPGGYDLGGSVVYAVERDINLMLEVLGEWEESVTPTREIERQFTFIVSPGFRTAWNLPGDTQIVGGIAAPISFSKGDVDYGVFFYFSVEHKFLNSKQ